MVFCRDARFDVAVRQPPNRPLSPERLRRRIAALGLDRVLLARNGAVGAVAAQLRPALLADRLGLSLSAAAAWSAVGAARGDHAALRADHWFGSRVVFGRQVARP